MELCNKKKLLDTRYANTTVEGKATKWNYGTRRTRWNKHYKSIVEVSGTQRKE